MPAAPSAIIAARLPNVDVAGTAAPEESVETMLVPVGVLAARLAHPTQAARKC